MKKGIFIKKKVRDILIFHLYLHGLHMLRAGQIQNVNGNELAKTPSFTANVALNWSKDVEDWGELRNTLQYIYRGGFKHRIFNNSVTDIVPSYDILDLVLGFYPDSADWHIELVAKNLTDEDGINARFTDVFGVGATGDELIAPRQMMVQFGMTF